MNAHTGWFTSLPVVTRTAVRDLFEIQPALNCVVFVFMGIWLGGATLITHLPWSFHPLLYLVMGASLHALGILMHEAIHGNFFRVRALDRLAAFLLGVPILISGAAYHVTHLAHHRHTRSSQDPDEFANYVRGPRTLSLLFYTWIIIGMFIFLIHVPLNALRLGTREQRRVVIAELIAMTAIYTTVGIVVTQLHAWSIVLHGWGIPLIVAFSIANVRGWSEHLMTPAGDPFMETRTVKSNRVVRFFMLNLNYHLEHHLCPGVPWYNIPRLHELLRDEMHKAGVFVYQSYTRFLWDAVRAGIHRVLPEEKP